MTVQKNRWAGEVKTILESTVGLDAYRRDERLREQVVRDFRENLAYIADVAREAGAQVIVVTPACQLRDCRPFKSEHRAGLTEDERTAFEAAVRTRPRLRWTRAMRTPRSNRLPQRWRSTTGMRWRMNFTAGFCGSSTAHRRQRRLS